MTVEEFLDYYEERAFLGQIYGTDIEPSGSEDHRNARTFGRLVS